MTFTLTINCDNDAFRPLPWAELGLIMQELADACPSCNEWPEAEPTGPIMDSNGNEVGEWSIKDDMAQEREKRNAG